MVKTSTGKIDELCSSNQKPRASRRLNGLQLPLHPQQILGWVTIVVTAAVNFTIIIPVQCDPLRDVSTWVLILLYSLHGVSHAAASLVDPAERQLRREGARAVAEFDRSLHAHVIENGRCHLCNIHTTDKSTKHCSICNKCVAGFDHHCKWLNHCIGERNYAAFFVSVTSATAVTFLTAVVCFCDVIFYCINPELLNYNRSNTAHQNATVKNETDHPDWGFGDSSDWGFFVMFLTYGLINLAICCALLHLCSFHIYISILGVSTYEYIVRNMDPEESESPQKKQHCKSTKCTLKKTYSKKFPKLCNETNRWHKNKVGNTVNTVSSDVYIQNEAITLPTNKESSEIVHKTPQFKPVTSLMTAILNNANSNIKYECQEKKVNSQAKNISRASVITNLPTVIPELEGANQVD